MGRSGPPPKPSALKKLQGTYRADRQAPNALAPQPGVPECPAWLDEVAREEWAAIVPQLVEAGVLACIDQTALAGLCANLSLVQAYQAIASKKPMVKNRLGGLVENPAAAAARKHWMIVKAFCAEFGLTPSARTRVSMPTKTKEFDEAEEFLFGPLKAVEGGKEAAAREEAARELERVKAAEAADVEPVEPDPAAS